MATIKLLSLSLSRNLNFELYRSRLLAQGFSLEQIEAYLSPGDRQLTVLSPTDVANIPGLSVATPSNPLLPAASPIAANFNNNNNLTPTFPQASNNWVVSGNLTATGKPFLASDPHLSLDIPSLWYLVHLESPNYNTIGASSLGAPLIVI
ncbi:penicillin acylase family protein, partial [Anaplasma marginale]|uniref:penicillin acylase family protein n=1 Tax=Anaplasma marginale TaxID=770 RepID=UPI001F515E5C